MYGTTKAIPGKGKCDVELVDLDHCHVPKSEKDNRKRNKLIIVSVLCSVFIVGELVGGYFANSLAIMSDAMHLFSDLTSFIISLVALHYASKEPTSRMSFGYRRAEVIGALTSVLIIWLVTGILVYYAVFRIIHSYYTIDANTMLITAGCGVAFNIIMALVLQCCNGGHGHSHFGHSHAGHSHSQTEKLINDEGGKKDQTKDGLLIRAALIHVLGDLVQSLGVLIAAFVIRYKPDFKLIDPICTFVFAVIVLCTTIFILKDIMLILMEAVPSHVDFFKVKDDLNNLPGAKMVHSLHIWSLAGDATALAVHIAIGPDTNGEDLRRLATKLLRTKYGINEIAIQVESYQDIMVSCDQCTMPKSLVDFTLE